MEQVHNTTEAGAKSSVADLRARAEKLKDQVASKAGQIKERVATKADSATSHLGERLDDVSESVRERVAGEGRMRSAARAVAGSLHDAGGYLKEHNVRSMVVDIGHVIRRHPVKSLLIGAGVGYLIARAIRNR